MANLSEKHSVKPHISMKRWILSCGFREKRKIAPQRNSEGEFLRERQEGKLGGVLKDQAMSDQLSVVQLEELC